MLKIVMLVFGLQNGNVALVDSVEFDSIQDCQISVAINAYEAELNVRFGYPPLAYVCSETEEREA